MSLIPRASTVCSLITPAFGSAPYHASAIVQSSPLTVQNNGVTGVVSSKGFLTGWFFLPSAETNWFQFASSIFFFQNPFGTGANNIFSSITPNVGHTAAQFQTTIQGSGGTVQINSSADIIVPDTWYCYLISFDLNHADGAKQLQQYILNTNQATTVTDGNPAFTINYSGMQFGLTDFAFLATSFGTPGAEFSDTQFWAGIAPDITDATNRGKIIDGTGKPVDPATAATAFGTQTILLSGNAAGFAVNKGLAAGGTFGIYTGLQATGHNGAGAVTLTGALHGSSVFEVANDGDFSDLSSDFEATISTAGQIQQTSASDLSATTLDIALLQGALTNAPTSPSD